MAHETNSPAAARPDGQTADEMVVVVGATGALGQAVVRRLAPHYTVLAVARSAEALAELSGAVPGIRTEVADAADDGFVAQVEARLDRPVRLALFAAGLSIAGSLDAIAPSDLARAVDLKVGGTVRLLHAVRDHLAPEARFVAVAGSLGFEPGPMDAGPGTVNAALANVMRQLSQLYGPRGVVTHTIAPGPLDTPRLRALAERRAQESGRTAAEVYAEYVAKTSAGRLPTVEDVAWLVETLLDPHAAALHGSVLYPDGGVRHAVT